MDHLIIIQKLIAFGSRSAFFNKLNNLAGLKVSARSTCLLLTDKVSLRF